MPALAHLAVATTLTQLGGLGLMSKEENAEILACFADDFPFRATMGLGDSLHLHIKVDAIEALPRARLIALGGMPENEKTGYVKFAFASGLNAIFSSIDVAQDDLILDLPRRPKPCLDHWGIDLRRDIPTVRAAYDAVPVITAGLGWSLASQGGKGKPVACCHILVAEKHWAFPRGEGQRFTRPIEFAYGPLTLSDGGMGCDLRPIDPASPAAGRVPACHAPDSATAPAATGYYNPADLARFGEMGKFAAPLMAKFLDYYNAATATDGALTKREKALIALAIAHSKQCPYCIDAYTGQCLATGSTPEQMHEAVHVASALGAGIDLVHGVQMQNALRAKGAM
jgi:alkylhydroperoxidase/carboxymuconolactone decarboxylase family protein